MGASSSASDILIQFLWILQGTAKFLYVTKRHEPVINFLDDNILLSPKHRIEVCKNSRMRFVEGIGNSQYSLNVYCLDILRNMPGYLWMVGELVKESINAQIKRIYSNSGVTRLVYNDLLKALAIFESEKTDNELLRLTTNRLYVYVIFFTQNQC